MIHEFKIGGVSVTLEIATDQIRLSMEGPEYRDRDNYPTCTFLEADLSVESARDIAATLNHLAVELEEK